MRKHIVPQPVCWLLVTAAVGRAGCAMRQRRAPEAHAPSVEQRLADLEAYVNNGARGTPATPIWPPRSPGPAPATTRG